MATVAALLRLTRAEHSLMLSVAVVAAEIISGGIPAAWILLLSVLSPALIGMSAFAINDYFDVESDTANGRRDRPIVSGAVTKGEALGLAAAAFFMGTATSSLIGTTPFLISSAFGLVSFLYSYRLKDVALVGNAYVALSMAVAFVYGSYVESGGVGPNILLICAVVFAAGLGREIQGAIRDYKGDVRARRTGNVVRAIGMAASARLAFLLYAIAVAITAYMFLGPAPFGHNVYYAAPIAVADIAMLWVGAGYLRRQPRSFFARARNTSLAAMALAILAYLAGSLAYLRI